MEIIKSSQEKGKTYINKMVVGERQLAASIQMYFLEMDPLATHTVASAAHNVLADLMMQRGKDPAMHGVIYGLLSLAKRLRSGEISEEDVHKLGEGVLSMVNELGTVFDKDQSIDIEAFSSSSSPTFVRAFWKNKRYAYNYLKHADKDHKELLDEATINNEDTILQAISCSQQLNMKHTAEKHFFICAMTVLGKLERNIDGPFDLEFLMAGMSAAEVKAYGRANLFQATFVGDDELKESGALKMSENAKKDIPVDTIFFQPS